MSPAASEPLEKYEIDRFSSVALFLLAVVVRLFRPSVPMLWMGLFISLHPLSYQTAKITSLKMAAYLPCEWGNKASVSPQTSRRRACHPLSCYLLFGNWIEWEELYGNYTARLILCSRERDAKSLLSSPPQHLNLSSGVLEDIRRFIRLSFCHRAG